MVNLQFCSYEAFENQSPIAEFIIFDSVLSRILPLGVHMTTNEFTKRMCLSAVISMQPPCELRHMLQCC